MPAKKNPARNERATASETPRRQSARNKAQPTKSPYFEHSSEDEQDEDEYDVGSDYNEAEVEEEVGDDDDEEVVDTDDEAEPDEEAAESEQKTKANQKRDRASSNATPRSAKKQKNEGETLTSYRAPSPGDIEYRDDRVHPNTLTFLKDLTQNNDRNWLHERDSVYRAAKADFETTVERLSELIPQHVDDTIPVLPNKDLVFRIHRDIRFSNDLTPYKTHFSAAWSRTGRKGPYACYYLQVKPGQSMAGGGLWHPESRALGAIRRDIDKHPDRLKGVITNEGFVEEFLGGNAGSKREEGEIVGMFAEHNGEDALKTAPKNYRKDHEDIELLRLRSFTIGKRISDGDVTSANFLVKVQNIFGRLEPLITYLNRCVMPDQDASDSDD